MTNLEVEIRKERRAEVNHRIRALELAIGVIEEQLQQVKTQLKALRQQLTQG